jgi:hypothetical protein
MDSTEGDAVRQGDLYIKVVADNFVPEGYVKPSAKILEESSLGKGQLVFGQNIGARHCLESMKGIDILVPKDWNVESFNGPLLRCPNGAKILHPTHGPIEIEAGMTVLIGYQKIWSRVQKQERRNRD